MTPGHLQKLRKRAAQTEARVVRLQRKQTALKTELDLVERALAYEEGVITMLRLAITERERLEALQPVPTPRKMGTMGRMELGRSADSRAMKIAKTKTAGRRAPEVQALYDAGLTPQTAATLCGTSRDVLKQSWASGGQFRPIRAEWKRTLAKHGVPESVWRDRS